MEDRWGPLIWIVLYLGGAVASALLWQVWNPTTRIPLVGASGAIAAAMGAFLITNYNAEIRIFYLIWIILRPFYGVFTMRAYWALPLWILQQLFGMWIEGTLSPIAYSAHVGGFALGIVAALIMKIAGADTALKEKSAQEATIYTQDRRYLEGLKQLGEGNTSLAAASFRSLLAEQPDNLDAALELYRIEDDPQRAIKVASRAVLLARRSGDLDTVISIYTDLNQRFPNNPLDERSLFTVAGCFEKKSDFSNAVAAYERLLEHFPRAVVAPKAMLNIAQLYATRLNLAEKADRILGQVITDFPDTPFAERASQLLAQGNLQTP
jgi:tetratricopeptide (TPR) repeat protein